MARAPKRAAPIVVPDPVVEPDPVALAGPTYEVADREYEIVTPAGVMIVHPGYYVVTDGDAVSAMPPERFAEAYPEAE